MTLSAVIVLQTTHGSLKKQEGIIVDKTSSIKLVLWEIYVDCLKEGKTYNLTTTGCVACKGKL